MQADTIQDAYKNTQEDQISTDKQTDANNTQGN